MEEIDINPEYEYLKDGLLSAEEIDKVIMDKIVNAPQLPTLTE